MKTIEDVLEYIKKRKAYLDSHLGQNKFPKENLLGRIYELDDLKDKIKESQMEQKEKPPLGIMPSFIWKEKRIEEIQEAMDRFMEIGKPIPQKWKDELKTLKEEVQQQPTTPKPFDIDRCLNEDGGRCIWRAINNEVILVGATKTNKNQMCVFYKDEFHTALISSLQNIPRRKERWFNFKEEKGQIFCENPDGYVSKDEALFFRLDTSDYIGDAICISSEEA